jgi:hypothetical protein
MRDRPPSQAAVEEEAAEGLVTCLATVARPTADVQAPAVLEDGLRAVRVRSRLERPIRADYDGGYSLRVALVDTGAGRR